MGGGVRGNFCISICVLRCNFADLRYTVEHRTTRNESAWFYRFAMIELDSTCELPFQQEKSDFWMNGNGRADSLTRKVTSACGPRLVRGMVMSIEILIESERHG
jgi:hypothetical protein